jgi:endonuclease/exonuclease/phosphatase (EEP) superfamily protein YafD
MKYVAPMLLVCGLLLTACSDSQGPDLSTVSPDPLAVSVLSRNVYIGADVDAVMAALADDDPSNDADALMTALATLQATDFGTRAEVIANEILANRPQVIGLAEITDLFVSQYVGLPSDIQISYLPVLQGALQARGLNYRVGAQVLNIDVSVFGGLVHLQDYDVVLYDADRVDSWETVFADNFTNNIGQVADGVVLKRGWIWGRVHVGSNTVDIVDTHPESGEDGVPDSPYALLRAAQMGEIVQALGNRSPVILMGDLNDLPGSPMYDVLTGAGFTDIWPALHPSEAGYTCCNLVDLSNATANFTKRIDFIFARGLQHPGGDFRKSWINLFGNDPAERLEGPAYPLWASDHGGLAAEFFVPPANGTR